MVILFIFSSTPQLEVFQVPVLRQAQTLPVIFMRPLLFIVTFFFSFNFGATSQITTGTLPIPIVKVTVSLLKNTFRLGDDIQLIMTLKNETKKTQSVWFDRPQLSTGGPAETFVTLTNKATGKSVLEYQNKALLISQIYPIEQVQKLSYQLQSGQSIKGQFSLYDMVVTKTDNYKLSKGTYSMRVSYSINASNIISFTVD